MKKTLIVLIHGGLHSASCWNDTIQAMHAADPKAEVMAVDLPGHGNEPGDLATLSIAKCVESVHAKIKASATEQVVIVGHSMGGLVIPGLTEKLGAGRVKRLIFISCCVPPEGKSLISLMTFPMNIISAIGTRIGPAVSKPFPKPLSLWMFANGMTKLQKENVLKNLGNESMKFIMEPVTRKDFPKVPMDWIMPLRDHMLNKKTQQKCIANLGGVDRVFKIDSCHNVMNSRPEEVARIILDH